MTHETLESREPITIKTDPALMSRITRDERIGRGKPIIRGTRTSVLSIVEYMELYGSKNQILETLTYLTPEDVDAALAYYDTHREEIEGYRREEEESENWELPNVYKP